MALSSEHSGFFNAQQTSGGEYDRTYDAEDFSNVFRQFLGNGIMITDEEAEKNTVFDKTTCGGLRTEASGNSIMYNDGWAFINGYWYHNSGGTEITPPSSVTNFKLVLALDLLGRRVGTVFMQWDGTEDDLDVTETEEIYEILLATGTRQANGTITNYTDRREKFITSSLRAIQNMIDEFRDEMSLQTEHMTDVFYPVGAIMITTTNRNPQAWMPWTQWQSFGAGRVLVGVDASQSEFNAVEKTGGEKAVTLNVNQIPSHNHVVNAVTGGRGFVIGESASGAAVKAVSQQNITSGSAGGGQAHNNLQPYITVCMWKRTR